MKPILSTILILTLLWAACENPENASKPDGVKRYSIEQFYENTRISGGSFSYDDSLLLVSSNESGIFNLFVYPVEGSPSHQLTHSAEESLFAISFFPHDNRILYASDEGGNEQNHIFLLDQDSNVTDLTPYEGSTNGFFRWSRDGDKMYFVSNRRNPQYFDLYELPVQKLSNPASAAQLIYKNTEGYNVREMSDDKRYLVLIKSITTSMNEMYLFDREEGEMTQLSEENANATYSPQYFSNDGKELFYLTNHGDEFTYLMKYNLVTGEKEKVYETDWDVWYAYTSFNEKYRVIGINEDAQTVVHVYDNEHKKEIELPAIEGGNITSVNISKSEKLMRLTVSSTTSPSNHYVYNLETGALKKLTNTQNPDINENDLVAGKVIRYESYDGLEIPAIYYEPKEASEDHRVPAILWMHGGPGGQSRLSYSPVKQYFVNHGYAILAVNNRGSSGYGKTFYKMDDQKHGEADLMDCVAAKHFLASTGKIDTNRIGIAGGSYGGYLTMAALTFKPDKFAVGVNFFGVTNWLRTLKSIPPYWESFKQALYTEMGDPTTADSVRLYEISPLFHADRVTKPLMVLQGANDVRVLKAESDDIVQAVRKNGVPVEYVVFDDEGHGFRKKENEIEAYGKVKQFLDKYLKGQPGNGSLSKGLQSEVKYY